MRRFFSILFVSVFIVSLSACREKIDINLDGTYTRLVVEATMTTDTTAHTVILSRTTDYYEPSSEDLYISNALVSITDGEQVYHLTEDSVKKGHYRTEPWVYGQIGKTYTLQISGVDMDQDGESESYTATGTMPAITDKLDSIGAVYGRGMPPFFAMNKAMGWNILLYAEDPPTKEYYIFVLSINDTLYYNTIANYVRMPDDFTQGLYINGLSIFFIEDGRNLKIGDTVGVEARSITAGYNQYISDVRDAISSSVPVFGSTPANVRGNISNGAIGYFAVYSNRRAYMILKTNSRN